MFFLFCCYDDDTYEGTTNENASAADQEFTITRHPLAEILEAFNTYNWQGVLICIVKGKYVPNDKMFNDFFNYYNDPFYVNAFKCWLDLSSAPRDLNIPGRPALETFLINPSNPELCFTYLVYQFNLPERNLEKGPSLGEIVSINGQRKTVVRPHEVTEANKNSVIAFNKITTSNRIFYAHCINTLFKNCLGKPQPKLMELLVHCSPKVIAILSAESKAALQPQLQDFYPEHVERIFPRQQLEATSSLVMAQPNFS